MIQISALNSLWEISLAIYVFFLFIDLFPNFEKTFPSIIYSRPFGVDDFLTSFEIGEIERCGWQGLCFRYGDIKLFGVISSPICIVVSFVLLIISGYFPNLQIPYIISVIMLILLFAPICFISYALLFGLKKLKRKYIINNLKYIRENTTDKDKIAKIDAFLAEDNFHFFPASFIKS